MEGISLKRRALPPGRPYRTAPGDTTAPRNSKFIGQDGRCYQERASESVNTYSVDYYGARLTSGLRTLTGINPQLRNSEEEKNGHEKQRNQSRCW